MFWRDYINGTLPMADSVSHYGTQVSFWPEMHQALTHLYGQPYLGQRPAGQDVVPDLLDHLKHCRTPEFFDFMEMAFKLPVSYQLMYGSEEIIDAINEIFRKEDFPYQLTYWIREERQFPDRRDSGYSLPPLPPSPTTIKTIAHPQIIRIDEEVTHQEAVRPALAALSSPHFRQANKEFLAALSHWRDGSYPDCLTACGTALESTLKVLCARNKWPYNDTDTLKHLLDVVIPNTSLDGYFTQPLMLIGTMRNRLSSAHGAGTKERSVSTHVAQYAITSTAAAIVLLVKEADR